MLLAFAGSIWANGLQMPSVLAQGANVAPPASAPIELPPVVVTTPSPVAKPAPAAPKPVVKAAQPAAPKAAPTPKKSASPSSAVKSVAKAAPAPQPLPPPVAPQPVAEAPSSAAAPAPAALPGTLIVATDTFAAVTVASEREIVAQPGATLTDTLQTKPGIVGSTFAPGANRPIVRGLDSYRVRVQENGIGSHDVSTISEDHAVPIDPFSADRVEVVRGPATLRYGSGAIGGVVAAENQRIPTFMPPRGISAEVRGGASSVDRGVDGAFKATAGADGFAVHADGFQRHADDYRSPRGRQRNSFIDSEGFGAGLSRIGADGFLGVSIARIDSVYGVPGEEADEGVDPRIDMGQDKLNLRGEWRPRMMGVEAVRLWAGASRYAHNELARHDGDEFEVGSRFTNREEEVRLEVQHLPVGTAMGELTGALGMQVVNRRTRGQSFEGDSLLEPAHTTSVAAFLFEELRVSQPLRLQVAARIEHTGVDGLGWSNVADPNAPTIFDGRRRFVPVSASVGALYDVGGDTVMRVTGQYVERAPDAAELFSKGIHEATGTFEIGNPFLDKEKATSIEVGLARAKGPLRFDASTYYTRYDGFVFRELQGVRCLETLADCGPAANLEDENFELVLFQQRDATFYGAELAAQYDVAPIWRGVWGVDARYDFTHARFSNGENVPRIPPHRLGGGVYYRDANWFARAGVLHAFDQTRIGAEEIDTPGYTLVSAELSYTARVAGAGSPRFTVGLRGENLADDEVLNHASFKRREEVLAPGANVRLFGSIALD